MISQACKAHILRSVITPGMSLARVLLGQRARLQRGSHMFGSGRPSGGGLDNPFLYSCLENPVDRGAWWATVHGVGQDSLKWLHTHPRPQPDQLGLLFTAACKPLLCGWSCWEDARHAETGSITPRPSVGCD